MLELEQFKVHDLWWALAHFEQQTTEAEFRSHAQARVIVGSKSKPSWIVARIKVQAEIHPQLCATRNMSAARIVLLHAARSVTMQAHTKTRESIRRLGQFLDSSAEASSIMADIESIYDKTQDCITLADVYSLSQDVDFIRTVTFDWAKDVPDLKPTPSDPARSTNSWASLPPLIITAIASHLEPQDLSAMRCVCRAWYEHTSVVVPGLNVQLYPHQRFSLKWMRQRETEALHSDFVNPRMIPISAQCIANKQEHGIQALYYFDTETGMTSPTCDLRRSSKGGLLCDDPGGQRYHEVPV